MQTTKSYKLNEETPFSFKLKGTPNDADILAAIKKNLPHADENTTLIIGCKVFSINRQIIPDEPKRFSI